MSDDRCPSSITAIGLIKDLVEEWRNNSIDVIQSGKQEEFESKVKPEYDYYWWTSSKSVEGYWNDEQRKYVSDVKAMMHCFRSFKEIYAENPDAAKKIHEEIVKRHKSKDFRSRRAADLLGVYFFGDELGFPKEYDFEDARSPDRNKHSSQEIVLLFDDDDYSKYGNGFSDSRFEEVNKFISQQEKLQEEQKRLQEEQAAEKAWRPVCRALANWKNKGYVLKWNESESEYELWSKPGCEWQFGPISSVKPDKLPDKAISSEIELNNLKKEIKEAYDDAKAHKQPPKETMEKMIEEEEKLTQVPQVNQTLRRQGGGVAVNNLDLSVYDNNNGRV